jgi:hypothetical protein
MPKLNPRESDESKEDATAPLMNRARAGTIPTKVRRPLRPSTLSSGDEEEDDDDIPETEERDISSFSVPQSHLELSWDETSHRWHCSTIIFNKSMRKVDSIDHRRKPDVNDVPSPQRPGVDGIS